MKKSADCLIIGAGLIGMLTARELARAGLRVLLLDRGRAGGESSWAGGGILSPLYPWRCHAPVTELVRWSQRRYPALADALFSATGVDPQWTASGLLILEQGEADEALAWARLHDVEMEKVDAAACLRLEPALGSAPEGGLWLPGVAQIRNPRLIAALKDDLGRLGVLLHEHEEVRELHRENGRVVGARTRGGMVIEVPRIVIAGGAWSSALLQHLGIDLRVFPVRGQMLLFRGVPGMLRRIVLAHGHYAIPRRDGHILVGSSVEEAGFDKAVTADVRDELLAAARALVPALADCPLVRHWAGLRPGSRSGLPVIGPVPGIEGLYLNTGHFRNGVVLGPASARLLADLILARTPVVEPAPFAVAHQAEFAADFL